MRCIIAGGRDFNDYGRLEKVMDNCPYEITEVVCGKARGADSLGEKWALERGVHVEYFVPDWEGLGRRAGFARNADMAEYACENGSDNGLLVAFWDEVSRGTKSMIDLATKKGMIVKVIKY